MPELLRAVHAQGYLVPTPVQEQAIPHVLDGRDLLAGAQTGTGKTAAFVLPILQRLTGAGTAAGSHPHPRSRPVLRCLVLAPTRELALQVEESVRTYGRHLDLRSTTIYGGVGFEPQARVLRAGVDIVVATPGRLLDHASQRTIDLRAVEILVLDEADRMLDMGFIHDIRRILALVPGRRQNLLLSATFSDDIRRLATSLLRDPAVVQVTPRNSAVDLVRQVVHPVERIDKRALLSHLVRTGGIDSALVFTRTKHGADRLADQLARDGISTAAIHGNKGQAQRVRALGDFKAGRVQLLVATEIAARGLDIDGLPHVVNYDLPTVPADYIHRIGRTGRAGMEGEAVSLVAPEEAPLLSDIERLLGRTIERVPVAGYQRARPVATAAPRTGGGPVATAAPRTGAGPVATAAPRTGGGPVARPLRRRPVRHTGDVALRDAAAMLPGERFRRPPGSRDSMHQRTVAGQRRTR